MSQLRILTAGESHGRALVGIIEGVPANLDLSSADIDSELRRRQKGFGRGGRMAIESDHAEILSGVRWGKTTGSPVSIMIENRDYANWREGMSSEAGHSGSIPPVTRPRPGHADLAGAVKYNQHDLRNILERSSARETAVRVGLGAIAKKILSACGITVGSYVVRIGSSSLELKSDRFSNNDFISAFQGAEASAVRCPDDGVSQEMVRLIEEAMKTGNSLGGAYEVFVLNLPIGLGSHVQWDRKLDGRLAQAVMSVQAVKAVEIGGGIAAARSLGSEVMDEIYFDRGGFSRKTNYAGGIEGGMTNGMPVIVRAAMKPIPTLKKPLRSVDIITKEAVEAAYERSDVCAVPAASVIGEASVALVVAGALIEKFGGDSLEEMQRNVSSYLEYVRSF